MKSTNVKDRIEQVVKINGVMKLKVTANKGTSVDFIALPEGYPMPEGPIEEIAMETVKTELPPAPSAPDGDQGKPGEEVKTDAPSGDQGTAGAPWKHECKACDFATNDEELWAKHIKSKAHKDKIAASGA